MQIISGKQAVRNRQSGRPFSQWSYPGPDTSTTHYETSDPDMGADRVYAPQLRLVHQPKFRLGPNASLFAAGSCFAREIEYALHGKNYVVHSWNPSRDIDNSLFHRYNTFSILNDFQFADDREYHAGYVCQIGEGSFIDYTGHGTGRSLEEVMQARRQVIDIYRNWREADVVIITLGLVEAFYDREHRIYLNSAPYHMFPRHPDRFELRITNYAENYAAIEETLIYLKSVHPALKVVLTVSPVPFSDTFSGQDVVIANTYSKATLRAVAQDLAQAFDHVDYFPSYELVTMSNPAVAWYPDFRHVRREHVEYIVRQFEASYMVDP